MMIIEPVEVVAPVNLSGCIAAVDRLALRGDLVELAAYTRSIVEWADHDEDSAENTLFRHAEAQFYATLLLVVAQIHALIEESQFESVECKRLHGRVKLCGPEFVNYDEAQYKALFEQGSVKVPDEGAEEDDDQLYEEHHEDELPVPEEPDLLFSASAIKKKIVAAPSDEPSGYASDDSDDEFDDDEFDDDFEPSSSVKQPIVVPAPKKLADFDGSLKSRKQKLKGLNEQIRKARAQQKAESEKQIADEARRKRITFRYQGKLEPSPSELIQRASTLREELPGKENREKQQIAMAAIRWEEDEWTKAVEADFQAAVKLFAAGNVKGIRKLKTRFCLAQYRGITYKTSAFDSRSRQVSRREDERSRAIFSMSVFRAGKVSPTDYFQGSCTAEEIAGLQKIAQKLKDVLVAKRTSGPVKVAGLEFDSAGDALQHIYTNEYDYFHSSVARYLANRDQWNEDQARNLAVVRAKALETETGRLEKMMPEILTQEEFTATVKELAGYAATDDEWLRYLGAHGLAMAETDVKRLRARKHPIVNGLNDYPYYRKERATLDYGTYERRLAEFKGKGHDYVAYGEYVMGKGEIIDAANKQVEDEAEEAYLTKRYGFIPPDDWSIFDGLLNGDCPFVSTGDNPRHALKYAYGMKFYQGHYHERLKPSWDADGKARRPYIGKVYASLHGLEEYMEDNPNHVPSMNLTGRIVVGNMISDEREATFPAFIPANRTVIEHIAKMPSFPGDSAEVGYRKVHLLKYGLDEEAFGALHGELREALKKEAELAKAPRKPVVEPKKKGAKKAEVVVEVVPSDEPVDDEEIAVDAPPLDAFLQKLCAWMVNYEELRLVELARRIAFGRKMYLIYRDSFGRLARSPTSTQMHKGLRLPLSMPHSGESPMELQKKRATDKPVDPRNKTAIITRERAAWKKPEVDLRVAVAARYQVNATAPDGNCLFHALRGVLASVTHGHAGYAHAALRIRLVDWMTNTAPLVFRTVNRLDAAYLDEMTEAATHPGQISRWGGDPEIIAFCAVYRMRVRVYSPAYPGEHWTEFDPPIGVLHTNLGYLLHVHGNHWEYLTVLDQD